MPQLHRRNRVTLAIVVYFWSATTLLAWILHRTRPTRERTWSALVRDATSLWETVPSELAVFVVLNFFVSALAMVALITATLFLGRLSVTESQRLSHRLVKYAVFKMVFVGSIITPDPRDIAVWLAWFAVVGYLRVFLGAAKDRLESLLSSPGAQVGRHARGVCLLLLVLIHNAVSFALMLRLLPGRSLARVLLCAFDSAVVAIEGLKTLLRYAVHMADRYQCLWGGGGGATAAAAFPAAAAVDDVDADLPSAAAAMVHGGAATVHHGGGGGWDVGCWSGKGSFLYHAELVADVLVHAVTLAHYLHVWVLHGLSFHLIDAVLFLDMRAVLLSLLRRLRSHLSYRAATQRLNNTFRDVHPAALAAGAGAGAADCTICMDEIVHVAKQLPCGHVFHLSCLRAWLQQSGSESFTCPNCRKPILVGSDDQADGADGGDGGRGQRRESSWWLVRQIDRLYVRLVVALEPLLLTLLLSITLWLGGRAQIRRRSARSPPSPPREGFGESPGPSSTVTRGGGRARSRLAEDSEDEATVAGEAVEEEYGSSDDDADGDGGGEGGRDDSFGLWEIEEEEEEEEESGDCRDADSDVVEADGERAAAAAAARQRGWREEDEEGDGGRAEEWPQRGGDGWRRAANNLCAALGAGRGCVGHCGGGGGGGTAAATAGRTAQPHSRRGAGGRCRFGSWQPGGSAGGGGEAGQGLGLEEQQVRPGARRRGGAGGRARRGPTDDDDGWGGGDGDGDGEGPSAAAAALPPSRRRGALRRQTPPSADVPSYSADVLVPQAAAVARRIGRTISTSLRSSLSAGGPCAGAVAWRGDDTDSDGEVSSRRRRLRPRGGSVRPGGGGGGGAHEAGVARAGGRSRAGRGAPAAGDEAGDGSGRGGEARRLLTDWN